MDFSVRRNPQLFGLGRADGVDRGCSPMVALLHSRAMAKPFRILKYTNEILTRATTPVEQFDAELTQTIDRMVASMREASGVGLAAPQVGLGKRLAVIEYRPGAEEKDVAAIPLTVLVNPRITDRSAEIAEATEGCLSLPGLELAIERATSVTVEYQDTSGAPKTLVAKQFFARIMQHELDHLDGVLILDRAKRQRATVLAYRANPRPFVLRAGQLARRERA